MSDDKFDKLVGQTKSDVKGIGKIFKQGFLDYAKLLPVVGKKLKYKALQNLQRGEVAKYLKDEITDADIVKILKEDPKLKTMIEDIANGSKRYSDLYNHLRSIGGHKEGTWGEGMIANKFKKLRAKIAKGSLDESVNEGLAFSIAGGIVLGVVGVMALVNGAKVAAGVAGQVIAKAGEAAEAKRAAKRAADRLKDKKAILDPIAKKFENDDKLKKMYADLTPYMGTSNAKNRADAKVRTKQLGAIAKYIKSKLTPGENAYFTDLSKYLRTGAPETISGGWHDDTNESVNEGKKYTVSDFKVGDRVIIARGETKPGVVKKVTKAPNDLVYVSWNPKRPSDESQAFRAHELIPESVTEAKGWNAVAKVMDAALKKANVSLSYAKEYAKSLEGMAKRDAKEFFADYGDFTEDDFIEDVEYNMRNESVTESLTSNYRVHSKYVRTFESINQSKYTNLN
tara:strand:+ start:11 stop:1372 length:1362 start_codon:yes stop_codon:yes gene_type:complete